MKPYGLLKDLEWLLLIITELERGKLPHHHVKTVG